MLPLEHQVNTLGQGKKLERLRVTAESYFVWGYGHPSNKKYRFGWWLIAGDEQISYDFERTINAYSCAELGVLLPEKIEECEFFGFWEDRQFNACYGYFESEVHQRMKHIIEYSRINQYEAHAKADLLIHLIEQKIIKTKELKL
jgi:hypothetical protein